MNASEGNGQLAVVPRPLQLAPDRVDPGQALYGPPRLSVSQAVSRYWQLLLVFPALFVAGALFYGLHRSPVYKAETRLNVGRIDVVAQATPGYVQATQSLASAYGQAATAEAVIDPTAARLGLSPNVLTARIDGTAVPNSSIVAIDGKGPTAASAMRAANATAATLTAYVADLNSTSPDSTRLLRSFRSASLVAGRDSAAAQRATRAFNLNPTVANRAAVARANATLAAANLRRDTLSALYTQAQQNGGTSASLSVLTSATSASSDRGTVLQRVVFIALVAGLALGVAVSVLLANQLTRRARPL